MLGFVEKPDCANLSHLGEKNLMPNGNNLQFDSEETVSNSKNPILIIVRNPIYLTRIFFLLIASLAGFWIGRGYIPSLSFEGSLIGLFVASIIVILEVASGIISSKKILLAVAGLFCGLVFAWLIYPTIPPYVFGDLDITVAQMKARVLCNLMLGYLGIVLALKHANRISLSRLNFIMTSPSDTNKILDTSVIIDGRIKELISANFIQGNFIVPEFVLDELQKLADSADSKKRARGRRGLEILEQIKEITPQLALTEKNYPAIKDVDHKLIALVKEIGGYLVTNDFNLQKVAHLHKVQVLNINELSNMLKPTVFVGENLTILINKEGKDPAQGIGYLDDGTMVVIEDGRAFIGETVEAAVTSILQTPAGRMIFARVGEVQPQSGRGSKQPYMA